MKRDTNPIQIQRKEEKLEREEKQNKGQKS